MSHLLRIVLIHGHLDGVVELALDGHTNICGTNASGKTTLQRLVPVFYGEQPNRVVPRTRKKFDDFYLPSSNSYLIYEYRREEGELCQAVLTRGATGVEYRFVRAAYDPEQYLIQTDQGVQGLGYSDFSARLRQLKIDSSRKLQATSEYRSVIQNDFSLLRGNSQEARNLRQLASQYSLVSSGHRIRHMEKLVSAVHAKEGKMDTLKTMLAAIFEEDGVELPVTRIRNTKAREWIQQMRQSMRLDSLRQSFAELRRQVDELTATEAELWQLYPLLEKDQAGLQREMADTEGQARELEGELGRQQDAFEQQRNELSGQLAEQQQALKTTQAALDDLQQRYDRYCDQDMPGLELDLQQLPQWREDQEQLQKHLQMMRDELGDSQQKLEARKLELAEQLERQSQQNYTRISQLRQQQQQTRDQQEQQKTRLEQDYQQQRSEREAEYEARQEDITDQLAELKARLQGSQLTDSEIQALELAQARLEQAQQDHRNQMQQVSLLDQELRQLQQARQQLDEQLRNLRQSVSQVDQQLRELHRQRDPEQGSLRHYLRFHQPGWEQSLGKVLRADLLERNDLAPQLLPAGEARIFDLQLDLNAIELPDYAQDEVALLQMIEAAEQQMARLQQQLQQLEKQLAEQNRLVEQQQQKLDQARFRLGKAEEDIHFATDHRNRLQEEQQQLQKQRLQQLRQDVQQMENRKQQLREQKQQNLGSLKHEFETQLLEFKADWQEQLAAFDRQVEQLEQQLADLRRDQQQMLAELEAAFNRELEEKQLDPRHLREAEQRLKQLQEKIRNTAARRDELDEYRSFMRVEWEKRKPDLLLQETRLKDGERQTSEQLEALKSSHNQQRSQMKNRLNGLKKQLNELAEQAERIKPLVLQLEQLPPPDQPPQVPEATQGDRVERMNRAQAALLEAGRLNKQVQDALHAFERELLRDAAPDFIEQLTGEQQRLQELPAASHPRRLLPVLSGMLQLLEGQQQALIEQGRNIGGDLNSFFRVFRDLNRRIQEQSRRLSKEVADDLVLDGISKSEVKIQSTIDELGFWEPLKHFAALYDQWKASGNPLPEDAYLNALADVVELLRSDQSYTFESLLRLELHLNEGGSDLVIRNDRQLLESSSHGMAYLILCKFLLAFTRLLRGPAQIAIHWPIDEIGTLAYHNVEKLFQACESNRIHIVGAFPNPESDVLLLFRHRYLIDRDPDNPQQRQLKRIEPKLSRLAERLQQRHPESRQQTHQPPSQETTP
ncbi:ATP-binding protein [Marinospirillum alkaliphilum]|uniref:Chromosome segregation ATPase n=1 Tax=Marinospirillum alkaliphilum DSM 21637 TaxID=1122209 RepID=A0A1K1YYJ9_9GAMM|nr:ATP-binding protein [Marinospirillum alkaliphilum]SFX66365.1 Chromosome segregation ATPase [Marinospirillum alkaliphilum DSM 21637]